MTMLDASTCSNRHGRAFFWPAWVFFFCFLLYFYVKIQPVVPWSADDWKYLSQFRDMIPTLARWNPARVLPEVLQPFAGSLASIVYAFCGDYIESLIFSHALFMAFGVAAVCAAAHLALLRMLGDRGVAACGALLFITLCFDMLKSRPENNVFLFYSDNVTLTFFYVMPNIVNSILVLYLLSVQYTGKGLPDSPFRTGGLLLFIYLAQFSMTFGSALACACACCLLFLRLRGEEGAGLGDKLRRRIRRREFFDGVLLFIVGAWMAAAVLDMMGGRYGRIRKPWNFSAAWDAYAGLLAQMNLVVLAAVVLLCGGALLRFIWKRRRGEWGMRDTKFFELHAVCAVCAVAMPVLAVCIGARTDPQCGGIAASYGGFFFLALCQVFSAAYLLTEIPRLFWSAPAVLALLLVDSSNMEKPWAPGYGDRAVVQSWLREAADAEARGEHSIVIAVPRLEWPHPQETFGGLLARTLAAHGVTRRRLLVTLREGAP